GGRWEGSGRRGGEGMKQASRKRVFSIGLVALAESFCGGGENRAIAGASTKVAAELVVEFIRLQNVRSVISFEERENKSRRAIAALRAIVLDHFALHRMKSAAGRYAFD